MPSLKEIKDRISSVNSTRKITSAMKMVASSKLHHAQTMIGNMLPYEEMLEHILKTFLASDIELKSVYAVERPVKNVALIVFSSNSSLCGGFNNNIVKMMHKTIAGYSGLTKEDFIIYPVGRKVAEQVQKSGYRSAGDFTQLADKPNVQTCIEICTQLRQMFVEGKIDKVELLYHHFKSAGSQILTNKTLIPIDITSHLRRDHERDLTLNVVTKESQEYLRQRGSETQSESIDVRPLNDNFIVEPDVESVMNVLVPKMTNLMVYTALLDSIASEHAARMVAMQTATDNADELLRQLNLQYNKSRQQAITNELLDIVGGSVNN